MPLLSEGTYTAKLRDCKEYKTQFFCIEEKVKNSRCILGKSPYHNSEEHLSVYKQYSPQEKKNFQYLSAFHHTMNIQKEWNGIDSTKAPPWITVRIYYDNNGTQLKLIAKNKGSDDIVPLKPRILHALTARSTAWCAALLQDSVHWTATTKKKAPHT